VVSRQGSLAVAVALSATLLAGPAGGGESRAQAAALVAGEPGVTLKTYPLPGEFKTPWQVLWIPDGTDDGAIAFTDRSGNQVGLLDPTTGDTQAITLKVITSPNGIAPIDANRFAVAGAGGVAIFDRSGAGTVRELQMAGTRHSGVSVGADGTLFVADSQNNDVRLIRSPYSGPSDISKFALPSVCRGPTGIVPGISGMTVLCGATNNVVDLDLAGKLRRTVPLPLPSMGAQEPRPSPNGFVFSGFNASRVYSFSASYSNRFRSIAFNGPAVPSAGYLSNPAYSRDLSRATRLLAAGKRPPRQVFFNTWAPSYKGSGFSLGAFPAGTSRRLSHLTGRNLVGSTVGPDNSIFVADATPGSPRLHRVFFPPSLFGFPERDRVSGQGSRRIVQLKGRTVSIALRQPAPDFLARISMPFFSAVPNPPQEMQVGVVGSSSNPWHVDTTFKGNFDLKIAARAVRSGGGAYTLKVASADTGAYTRVLRITGFKPQTTSLTLTLTGKSAVPVNFGIYAQTPAR
jgi:hypothetical protein